MQKQAKQSLIGQKVNLSGLSDEQMSSWPTCINSTSQKQVHTLPGKTHNCRQEHVPWHVAESYRGAQKCHLCLKDPLQVHSQPPLLLPLSPAQNIRTVALLTVLRGEDSLYYVKKKPKIVPLTSAFLKREELQENQNLETSPSGKK